MIAAIGVTACDSNDRTVTDSTYQQPAPVESGTTTEGTVATTDNTASTGMNNAAGSGVEEKTDVKKHNAAHEKRMKKRKVAPDHSATGAAVVPAPTKDTTNEDVSSGASSDEDIWSNPDETADTDSADAWDEDLSSGTSREAETEITYSQTPHRGGIAPQDRNLRYGLIGNGTGMGMEDTTSKYLTDNDTLADPLIGRIRIASSGALSAPTDEQDALKDIKSGTSFDADEYHIEE